MQATCSFGFWCGCYKPVITVGSVDDSISWTFLVHCVINCADFAVCLFRYGCVKHWIPKNSKMWEGLEWTSTRMGRPS